MHKLSNTQFILMYHSVVKAASACILTQSSDIILQKSSDMLNKNTLGVYKKVREAACKHAGVTKSFDIS